MSGFENVHTVLKNLLPREWNRVENMLALLVRGQGDGLGYKEENTKLQKEGAYETQLWLQRASN